MPIIEKLNDNIKSIYIIILGVSILLWPFIGLPTIIELMDRERTLAEKSESIPIKQQAILANMQQADKSLDENNNKVILMRVDADLLEDYNSQTNKVTCLKTKISEGVKNTSKDKIDKVSKCEESSGIFSIFLDFSSNALLAPLILFSAFTGSVVQILRRKEHLESCSDIFIPILSGLFVGFLCVLILLNGNVSDTSYFDFLTSLSSAIKVLIALLLGMFMDEVYEFLSKGVPQAFGYVRNMIPGKKQKSEEE